jgi:sodium/potassium-transporting ATPase subunit alpha
VGFDGREQFDRQLWTGMGKDSSLKNYNTREFQTYQNRKILEYTCQTAYFVAIVIVQWAGKYCV